MCFNTRPVGRAFKKKIPGMRFREGNVKSLVVHLVVCTTSLTYRERQRQRETEKFKYLCSNPCSSLTSSAPVDKIPMVSEPTSPSV